MEPFYMLRATMVVGSNHPYIDEGEALEELWLWCDPTDNVSRSAGLDVAAEGMSKNFPKRPEGSKWGDRRLVKTLVLRAIADSLLPFYFTRLEIEHLAGLLQERSRHTWQDFAVFQVSHDALFPLFTIPSGHRALMLPPDVFDSPEWSVVEDEGREWCDDITLNYRKLRAYQVHQTTYGPPPPGLLTQRRFEPTDRSTFSLSPFSPFPGEPNA